MVSHTQEPVASRPVIAGPPTYGELMDRVDAAFGKALLEFEPHRIDLDQAHAELMGYERFLRVSGHHLKLLASLGQSGSEAWRTLGDRLAQLPMWPSGEGLWSQAALLLATAHDVVATHVGPQFLARTPDLEDLAGAEAPAAVARHLIGQLDMASRASGPHLDRLSKRHRSVKTHPTSGEHLRALRSAGRDIAVHGRAARWDLRAAPRRSAADQLYELEPSPAACLGRTRSFASSLDALRLLRYLSHVQARGRLPASTLSLRDLALLGADVTDPSQLDDVHDSATALHRLEHAHLKDQLSLAHRTWNDLAEHMLAQTQGLTKAPRDYALAVDCIRSDDSPAARSALARAFPDLGRCAGETVRQLARRNALITRQKAPASIQAHWRPLNMADSERLAELFVDAGAVSALAAEAYVIRYGDSPGRLDTALETLPRARGLARTDDLT